MDSQELRRQTPDQPHPGSDFAGDTVARASRSDAKSDPSPDQPHPGSAFAGDTVARASRPEAKSDPSPHPDRDRLAIELEFGDLWRYLPGATVQADRGDERYLDDPFQPSAGPYTRGYRRSGRYTINPARRRQNAPSAAAPGRA